MLLMGLPVQHHPEAGSSWGQCNYGFCLYQGIGVEMDDGEAVRWFRKAAEQGSAPRRPWQTT